MEIVKSSYTITTGNKYIDELPEQHRSYVKIGTIMVLKTDINTSHPYFLIKDVVENSVYVRKYMYHSDICKSKNECEAHAFEEKEYSLTNSDFVNYYLKEVLFSCNSLEELNDYFKIIQSDGFDLSKYELHSTDSESALVHLGSPNHLISIKNSIESKANELQRLSATVSMLMFEQRKKLDIIRREMDNKISKMRSEIGRIEKVLWTIELYLGVKESVVLINDGDSCSEQETLRIFQTCSYMDEEVANPEDQGIDMNSIDKFDQWLCSDNTYHKCKNYELLMYPRSVKLFRVRRENKKYNDNPIVNGFMNQENKKTYILIRNGHKLYRIWADINIEKFFPDTDEFENISKDKFYSWNEETIIEKQRDAFIHYQRHFIMLQGIIDRTEVFSPMPKLKLTESFNTGQVEYLYTNHKKLPTERPLFSDWKTMINKHITEGSRIIIGNNIEYHQTRFGEQFYSWNRHDNTWGLPHPPEEGLYVVDRMDESTGDIFILFDHIKEWESNPTKGRRKISYRITKSDTYINYDLCTLDNVEYYIYSNEDRKHYLQLMPLLMELKSQLLKDKEEEIYFAQMIVDDFKRENLVIKDWVVWKQIDWWKTKNKWKRSLNMDNSKAYRMIKSKVLSKYKSLV